MASEVDGKGTPLPAESKVPQNIHQKGMEEMKLQERPLNGCVLRRQNGETTKYS